MATFSRTISHALVLPDKDFMDWYRAAEPYTKLFPRVAVVRSPAGNDLNRWRDVSAVQTPGVWFDNDALAHIRRAYPNVVRVDVIRAATPADMARVLEARMRANDRFGESMNGDGHLHDRFVLGWPAEGRPARITLPFNAEIGGGKKHEGIDVKAQVGTGVRASAAGTVANIVRQPTALGYGEYVQIAISFGADDYLVTYAHLQDIAVNIGQAVKVGDVIARSGSDNIKLVVQKIGDGLDGYLLPDVVDPIPMIYWEGLRLRPMVDGLRLRERPGTEFNVVGQVYMVDTLETLEQHGRTLVKIGVENQWIQVRSASGVVGYAASWYLTAGDPVPMLGLNMTGVNLDLLHPLGKPGLDRVKGMGWVRIPYNVSNNRGSTDLDAAYARYAPYLELCARMGLKTIVVLGHQTWGEGQGYVWPQMTSERWREFSSRFVPFIRRIVERYAGKNWVTVYQIWNEQDAPPEAVASVSMPPGDYAFLLAETIKAIRAVDPGVKIITGGHTGGPGRGSQYARATIASMPPSVRPDGIASHPYGRGTRPGPPYAIFGHIDDEVEEFSKVLPASPVWLTEWGVLDRQTIDPPDPVSQYANEFITHLKSKYPDRVMCAVWYAWADGMHNGYGLVGTNDQPKQPLYERYLKL